MIMSKTSSILSEISTLIRNIETNYPGLYRNLDESAMSFSDPNDLEISEKTLNEYLQTLKDMLKPYKLAH